MRALVVLGVGFALATQAAAQMLPVPGRVEHWVEVGRDVRGGTTWFNAEFIVIETYYRAARFRFDDPGQAPRFAWYQFDCDGGALRLIERVDMVGEGHTAVPASGWIYFNEGETVEGMLVASAAREKLCNWGR